MPQRFDSQQLAKRLKIIRFELFGEGGIPELAKQLGIPAKTWSHYETGVTIPGEVLVKFIVVTSTDPLWLMTGEGSRVLVRSPRADDCSSEKHVPNGSG